MLVVRISTFLIREGLVLFLILCKCKAFFLYKQLFFLFIEIFCKILNYYLTSAPQTNIQPIGSPTIE
jgi:hypothetical protein